MRLSQSGERRSGRNWWSRFGAPPRCGSMMAHRLFTAGTALMMLAAALVPMAMQTPTQRAPELTVGDRLRIDSGRQVVHEQSVAHSPWPRVTVRQYIGSTPEEAAAVFTDYARHSTFMPGIRKSVVSPSNSPRVVTVDYLLAVPIFRDEDYTVRDSLSVDGASYQVDWTRVRARSTKEIVGSARFEPYHNARTGRDGTLITYVNLVVPGQMLAGPLKGRALGQVRTTVTALANKIEAAVHGDRALLAAQITMLAAAMR